MEALARKLASVVSDQTSASPEDREVHEFAMRLLINSVADVVVILSLAHLLGVLRIVAFAYILLAVLKYFAGGAHASKMLNCLVIGVTVFTSIGLSARALAQLPTLIAWGAYLIVALVAITVFYVFAPAVPPQKPLRSIGQRTVLRRCAMITLVITLILGLMWLKNPFAAPELFWAGCISLVWQSLILLPVGQRLFDRVERYLF